MDLNFQRSLHLLQQALAWQHHLPPATDWYHALLSCVLSQKISFAKSRCLRANLYQLIGTNHLVPDRMAIVTKDQLQQLELPDHFIAIIRHPLLQQLIMTFPPSSYHATDQLFTQLYQLPGVGIWTVKAIKIMTYADPAVFLVEDLYLRSRLSTVYDMTGRLTIAQAEQIKDYWQSLTKVAEQFPIATHFDQLSLISRFLWRLKDTGANKIQKLSPIDANDLI